MNEFCSFTCVVWLGTITSRALFCGEGKNRFVYRRHEVSFALSSKKKMLLERFFSPIHARDQTFVILLFMFVHFILIEWNEFLLCQRSIPWGITFLLNLKLTFPSVKSCHLEAQAGIRNIFSSDGKLKSFMTVFIALQPTHASMGSLPEEVYNLHDKQVIKTCLTPPVMWPMADWYL